MKISQTNQVEQNKQKRRFQEKNHQARYHCYGKKEYGLCILLLSLSTFYKNQSLT